MYRDDPNPPCPACPGRLDSSQRVLRCTRCSGTWVSHDELDGRLGAPLVVTVVLSDAPPRRCPICREPMDRVESNSVTADRCASDGMWFDYQEFGPFLRAARGK